MLLVAGGSGIVPLMAMIRARAAAGSRVPFRLVYSVRDPDDVDLRRRAGAAGSATTRALTSAYVYTRAAPAEWRRPAGRLDRGAGWPRPAGRPSSNRPAYVCGPTGFVEAAADMLVAAGHPRSASGPNASGRPADGGLMTDTDTWWMATTMAGALRELFAVDVTVARGRCVGCGREGMVAEARVYDRRPDWWLAARLRRRCCCGWSAGPSGRGSTCAACSYLRVRAARLTH